jgi:hypothetical protein
MLLAWTLASATCAAIPALLTLANLAEYQSPLPVDIASLPAVCVVIPARNEEEAIVPCVEHVLASRGVDLQVLVVDDASTDSTTTMVQAIAAYDARVQLLRVAELPTGWNGKQHACWQGAQAASLPVLCFLDADVRLQPEALARMASLMVRERAALVSGFPREITGTLLEKLLIPLIHFVLLGLLPMRGLRRTTRPGFAAGCGQFLMVDRSAYFASGGHEAIRATMHDGLLLPKLLRQHGYPTRLADLTFLASCRMYRSARETWSGLAKNATEGLAAPARIVPMTLLLGLGQVLPIPLLLWAWLHTSFIIPFLGPPIRIGMGPVWAATAACLLSYLPRLINTVRYRQSWLGALMHPLGMTLLLMLQWLALLRKISGRSAGWKGRNYAAN